MDWDQRDQSSITGIVLVKVCSPSKSFPELLFDVRIVSPIIVSCYYPLSDRKRPSLSFSSFHSSLFIVVHGSFIFMRLESSFFEWVWFSNCLWLCCSSVFFNSFYSHASQCWLVLCMCKRKAMSLEERETLRLVVTMLWLYYRAVGWDKDKITVGLRSKHLFLEQWRPPKL